MIKDIVAILAMCIAFLPILLIPHFVDINPLWILFSVVCGGISMGIWLGLFND